MVDYEVQFLVVVKLIINTFVENKQILLGDLPDEKLFIEFGNH